MDVSQAVYSAKWAIIKNKLRIHEALERRDTLTAARLRSVNDQLRRQTRERFGVVLDV